MNKDEAQENANKGAAAIEGILGEHGLTLDLVIDETGNRIFRVVESYKGSEGVIHYVNSEIQNLPF